ncbi:MAG: RNA polymerase sigma factor [Lewinellaceae bacterium]|nr:RNA polymerase sigma factor [Saprospiraceae bacterium]MCB9340029.1 RNA polymerase sigma factor [Lewinellaceae bacterium]
MVDSSIIELVKKREKGAFKTMYQSCIGYVYSVVRRYVGNESDHPDVIQEIFARAFLSIHTFDQSKGEFKFWLRRLVINQCLQHYRKKKSSALIVPLDVVKETESDDALPLHELSREEIEGYLEMMPEAYRQIFMLHVIDEYSHKEVSDLLDISIENSRTQVSRAKSWLRKKLFDNGSQKLLANGF